MYHHGRDCASDVFKPGSAAYVPVRGEPCKLCGVWHVATEFDACQSRVAEALFAGTLGVPCARCNVWHGTDSCAVTIHPFDLDNIPQHVPVALFENRAVQQNDRFGFRDAASERHRLGAMSNACNFCRARFWPGEKINCCYEGSLILPEDNIPVELQNAILAAPVRADIRQYNMSLAMASVGHKNKSLPDGTFVMGGRSYHRIGELVPRSGAPYNFAQIYILDTTEATARRQEIFGGRLRNAHLAQLHELLVQHNPHVSQFRRAAESSVAELVWSSEQDLSGMQMGAIVSSPGHERAIIIRRLSDHPKGLTTISDSHALYHTLAYPLLFPTGQPGWHWQMQRLTADLERKRVSLTDYMRYQVMHRDVPSHLQRCERLSLEYYCDTWAQVEARAASFHRQPTQQARYRVGRKCAIDDQLAREGGNTGDASIPMILPSSFVGSSKWYHMVSAPAFLRV